MSLKDDIETMRVGLMSLSGIISNKWRDEKLAALSRIESAIDPSEDARKLMYRIRGGSGFDTPDGQISYTHKRLSEDDAIALITADRARIKAEVESALALDDGPTMEGDACGWERGDGKAYIVSNYTDMNNERMLSRGYRQPVLLMRAEEVAQRIKEAGK